VLKGEAMENREEFSDVLFKLLKEKEEESQATGGAKRYYGTAPEPRSAKNNRLRLIRAGQSRHGQRPRHFRRHAFLEGPEKSGWTSFTIPLIERRRRTIIVYNDKEFHERLPKKRFFTKCREGESDL